MCQKSKVTIKCAVCTCIGILSHLGGTAISQRWNYALTWVKCPFLYMLHGNMNGKDPLGNDPSHSLPLW